MISINELPIITGTLDFQFRGPWIAQVEVGEGELTEGDCEISDGTFSLSGTVVLVGRNGSRISAAVTGGKGGMGSIAPARHYKGVKVSKVIEDICSDAGESPSPAISRSIKSKTLDFWSTPSGKCGWNMTMLANHLGTTWGVDDDGKVLVGYDTGLPSLEEYTVLNSDFSSGNFTVAPEGFPLRPGSQQQDSTVKAVEYSIGNMFRAKYWLK